MATFAYRAIDQEGQISSGQLEALNVVDLELRLKRLGLDLITGDPVGRSALLVTNRISKKELINFCFHLEQMLAAGVQIIEALTDLRDTVEAPAFRTVIASLLEDIEGGRTLSAAMANHPQAFDTVFVALVKAGESAGQLPEVLRELTENLKWQDETAGATLRALAYPSFVLAVVILVFITLMLWLVPTLGQTVGQMVPKLPVQTEILLAVSRLMQRFWYLIPLLPALTAAVLALWLWSSESARFRFDQLKLRLPLVGRLLGKIMMARFSTFFALMYRSGIAVLDCIRLSERIVGNRVVAAALARIGQGISEGQSITAAFHATKLFPPLVLRMLRVGESTGQLDHALANVSYFYNREVREEIGRLQAAIGPLTTVILGGLIGLIIMFMFLPIYDVIVDINRRTVR